MASISAGPAGVVDASARLRLLETLLRCDDVEECARRTLGWLGESAEVSQGIGALADLNTGQLSGVAGYRVSAAQINKIVITLSDLGHPFVQALSARAPILLRASPDGATSDRHRLPRPFGR